MAAAMIAITGSFRSDKRALNSRNMGLCFLATLDRLEVLTTEGCQRITAAKNAASTDLADYNAKSV
jgi:hypothetical protein